MVLGATGPQLLEDQRCSKPAPPLSNVTQMVGSRRHLYSKFPCEHCGKEYFALHHLEQHQRGLCHASKRKIADLLASTKEFWETRKKRCLHQEVPVVPEDRHGAVDKTAEPLVERGCTAGINPPLGGENGASLPMGAVPSKNNSLDTPLSTRRTRREIRLPARYRQEDILPQALPTVEQVDEEPLHAAAIVEDPTTRSPPRVMGVWKSRRNDFGIMRMYRLPQGFTLTHDPDKTATLWDLTETTPTSAESASTSTDSVLTSVEPASLSKKPASTVKELPSAVASRRGSETRWGPFPNNSSFSLADWYWDSKNKSFADFQKLLAIFKQPDFSVADILDVNWKNTFKALGANREDLLEHEAQWINDDGWRTTPISIEVPFHHRMRRPGVESYVAGSFRHRSIVSVIKEKISNRKDAPSFHYQPYRATWKPAGEAPEVEVYGELYASRAFREAHEEVHALPVPGGDDGLERVVVAMMFWSDGTQLTSFGGASLWPCYLFFGNESKYRRCQPSERLGEQLSDDFDDYLRERNNGKLPTDGLYAHCSRELFQKQWGIMLDDELKDAMKHGIVLLCPDGRQRRFYPRIFTYSADYPEKILLAGLRNNGGCPCHRCLIEKADLWKLGSPIDTEREDNRRDELDQKTKVDLARAEIAAGFAVDGTRIDKHLKSESMVPVHNAFSTRIGGLFFKIIRSLVVDLMHEFEIGVWKKLFIHLIRLLEAFASLQPQGSTLTAVLDYRFRKTPPFGRDRIRSFAENASEMKRRAARDYEDLLQCAIPAFESLLPEPHNSSLMKLLYICAQWHALAKLRMHHDYTLQLLQYTTTWLGAQLRLFDHDTCSRITTKELKKESEAREKREGKGNGKASTRKPVKFNIFTIKLHYLGDYVSNIQLFGTTDSFSTETGELFHRFPKSWFGRTDRRDYEGQLSQIERRPARLDQIRHTLANTPCQALKEDLAQVEQSASVGCDEALEDGPVQIEQSASTGNIETPKDGFVQMEQEATVRSIEDSPDLRYTIGVHQNSPIDIASFSNGLDAKDPYLTNFIQKLKQHLLPRLISHLGFPESTSANADWVDVALTRLYSHKLMRINYTTYDVRRDQDVIHVGTPQSNIMLLNEACTRQNDLSYATIHPYLYANVIGIYHANVSYIGSLPDGTRDLTAHRIDFAWVHWYDILDFGKEFTLDRLALCPVANEQALGFVDPSDIIRSVHLIPQFSLGPPKTISRAQRSKCVPTPGDVWEAFYINKFADRDLFMRYQYGMAVGHAYMRKMHPCRMTVPSIPADFEHWLSFPESSEGTLGALAAEGEFNDYVEPSTDVEDTEDLELDNDGT